MQLAFSDWSLPIGLTTAIVVAGILYLRGWMALRRTRWDQFSGWRLLSFFGGLLSLWIAIGSPLETLADSLLSAHMIEHLILMSIVPPLVLAGLPVVPLLRGLPTALRNRIASPLLRVKQLRLIGRWLVRPTVAWLLMNLAFLAWHVPAAYDFALEHEGWHEIEHVCFFSTSLLFWWCVIRPWPAAQQCRQWSILIYLVGADVVNTALSAFLAFCNRPIYAFYVQHPNPYQANPLSDQVLGAVVMWVIGSMAFLIPAAGITFSLLQPSPDRRLRRLLSTH